MSRPVALMVSTVSPPQVEYSEADTFPVTCQLNVPWADRGASQPIDLGHHQRVALADVVHRPFQFRPLLYRRLFEEELAASGLEEMAPLGSKPRLLLGGRLKDVPSLCF